MNDITRKEIKIGDKVIVALTVSELKIGTVIKLTPKKIRVKGVGFEGLFYPTGIFVLPKDIIVEENCILYKNDNSEKLKGSVKENYEKLLKELNVNEFSLTDLDKFSDFIEFSYKGDFYTFEAC